MNGRASSSHHDEADDDLHGPFDGGGPRHGPGSDQALFERLGFETRFDADLGGGFRWLELAPPGAVTSIALVASGDGLPTGVDTGIRLVTPDARAAHAELLDLGLTVGELLDWETAPLMFSFCDLDGNRLYVAEPS